MEPLDAIRRIIVHHSASGLSTTLEDIKRWHLERGFEDVGYHYVIESNGLIRYGRRLPLMGAHTKGSNWDSIGVCLVGDMTREDRRWTWEQWESLYQLVGSLKLLAPHVEIIGHREAQGAATECPAVDVYEWLYAAKHPLRPSHPDKKEA